MLLSCVITVLCPLLAGGFPQNDYFNLFNPQNYLQHLPSLSLPYLSSIPIPSMRYPSIRPTPAVTTKVINVVTKYVGKNPVCLKISGKKPPCSSYKSNDGTELEYLVTKEYFVRDPVLSYNVSTRPELINVDIAFKDAAGIVTKKEKPKVKKKKKKQKVKSSKIRTKTNKGKKAIKSKTKKNGKKKKNISRLKNRGRSLVDDSFEEYVEEYREPSVEYQNEISLQSSEVKISTTPRYMQTPSLLPSKIQDLLIEDRLDQLEQVLPHYTRRRVYQTSTVTVTKFHNYNLATATLMVRNCIPQGIEVCPDKTFKKKKKPTTGFIRYTKIPTMLYG